MEEVVGEVMTVVVVEVETMLEVGGDLVVMEAEEVVLKVAEVVRGEEDLEEEEEEGVIRGEEAEVAKVQVDSKGTKGTLGLTRIDGPREEEEVVIKLFKESKSEELSIDIDFLLFCSQSSLAEVPIKLGLRVRDLSVERRIIFASLFPSLESHLTVWCLTTFTLYRRDMCINVTLQLVESKWSI